MARQRSFAPIVEWRDEKETAGRFSWTVGLYPTEAMAAEARLSLSGLLGRGGQGLLPGRPRPQAPLARGQGPGRRVHRRLNALPIDRLHVTGPDADLWMTLGERRQWVGGSGRNIPSFESTRARTGAGPRVGSGSREPLYTLRIADHAASSWPSRTAGSRGRPRPRTSRCCSEMIATEGADRVGEYSLTDARLSRITKFMADTSTTRTSAGPTATRIWRSAGPTTTASTATRRRRPGRTGIGWASTTPSCTPTSSPRPSARSRRCCATAPSGRSTPAASSSWIRDPPRAQRSAARDVVAWLGRPGAGRAAAGGAAASCCAKRSAWASHGRHRTRSRRSSSRRPGSTAASPSSSPGSSAPTACTAITRPACGMRSGAPPLTCSGCGPARRSRRRIWCSRPTPTNRCWRSCGDAARGGSRSSRSAAGPRWSGACRRTRPRSRGSSRSTCAASAACVRSTRSPGWRRSVPACVDRRPRQLLGAARLHARALSPVVRVRDARRVRRDALHRPGVGGIRALRRPGDGDASRRPGRHARARPRAAVRRRPGPAPVDARLRGHLRGDHLADHGDPPAPAARVYEGWRFASFAAGARALRALAQDGPWPTVLRLSDEAETALNLARPGSAASRHGGSGCLAIVGFEGAGRVGDARGRRRGSSRARRAAAPRRGRQLVGGPLPRRPTCVTRCGAGALVETLETACFWSGLTSCSGVARGRRRADGEAPTPPMVLCHVSHVYPAGASLYFTVAGAHRPTRRAVAGREGRGRRRDRGGRRDDHAPPRRRRRSRPWYEREIGELGVEALRSVKRTLDPAGILNPGVLIGAADP